jgi:hypothetical protein
MAITKLDIGHDNFDNYFAKQIVGLNEAQKTDLPEDITLRLFRNGGAYRANSSFRLTFLHKLLVLWKAIRSRFFIVVESKDGGMTVEDFFAHKAAIKKRDLSSPTAKTFEESFSFVTGSKDLMDYLEYLNDLSRSPAYHYLSRGKNTKKSKQAVFKDQRSYVLKFLANYEGCKKTMVTQTGLSMSDIMVLFVLYPGHEVKSNLIYTKIYRYSFHTSQKRMKISFGVLQSMGYITKVGGSKATKLKVTALGISKLDEILEKYILNP